MTCGTGTVSLGLETPSRADSAGPSRGISDVVVGIRPEALTVGADGIAARVEVVQCHPEADRERAGQHGGLPQARDLDARRIRQPALDVLSHGAQQQVAVGADTPTQYHQRHVGHSRDGHDVERDAAGRLRHDLGAQRVAPSSHGEHVPRVGRCRGLRAARRSAANRAASLAMAPADGSKSSRLAASIRSTSPAAPWRPRCSSP